MTRYTSNYYLPYRDKKIVNFQIGMPFLLNSVNKNIGRQPATVFGYDIWPPSLTISTELDIYTAIVVMKLHMAIDICHLPESKT